MNEQQALGFVLRKLESLEMRRVESQRKLTETMLEIESQGKEVRSMIHELKEVKKVREDK